MKGMKRILAMLLAVVMVVGLIPATVFAADTVLDAAIFCSDVHGSTSDLTSVLSGVKTSGVTYSSIGFVGDTCLTVANTTSTVTSALGHTPTVMFSYASSHDNENSADISTNWNYSGEVEDVSNYYLVYTIRETDMQNASDAATAAPAFTSWYNGLTAAEKKLPIFIMSHRPLHDRRDDNAGAATWYSAISAAAETSDIVVFWAHNHTQESSVDTAAYYVAKDGDETFTVYNGDTVVPNFTYMNAGYINANNQDPARLGVATTVKITADSLIFQDYNSSGEYSGTYAHNVTVTREFAASEPEVTLTSIEVSGETEYTVGGNGLDLTVTATYDDGTTADVTADATFSPAELTASGKYTVTASYGGLTDTIDVTVNLYDEVLAADGESLLMGVEAFSQGATALEVTWDDAAEAILDEEGLYTDYVVYDLAVTNPGETATYSMSLVDNMDTTNLAVYHVADDGTLTAVDYKIENDCVVFTTSLTGAFAYGVITVPEGYTLASVTLAGIPTDLFVGGSLDLMNAVITATYTKEGAEDFVRQLTVYDYDENNFSGYDVNVVGAQTAVFTYESVTAELPIHVWGHDFTSGDVTVHVDGKEYGVTNVTVTESTNANVETAIQYVIEGDNYVAYDISLTYSEGYSATTDTKTVTLPIPEGIENPVVYYVPTNGQAVNMNAEITEDGEHVTFTTTHFSTYVLGDGTVIETESSDAKVEGSSTTTTEEKTVYVKVDAPVSGEQYLIVSTGTAGTAGYILGGSSVTPVSGTLTVNGADGTYTYIETTGTLWTASGNGSSWSFQNADGTYLGYTQIDEGDDYLAEYAGGDYSYDLNTTGNTATWIVSNNQVKINLQSSYAGKYYGEDAYSDYYLSGGTSWSMSTTAANVYFYKKVTATVTTTTGTVGHTYSTVGTDVTDAIAIKGETVELSSVLYDTPDGGTTTEITTLTPTYEVVTTKGNPDVIAKDENGNYLISGNTATLSGVAGTAVVKVTYTSGDLVAWDEFIVTTTTPDHYSIDLHKAAMTVATGVTADNVTNYYVFNTTTGVYEKATSYVEGTTYYTTPVIEGDKIADNETIALKGIEAGDTYSAWAVVKAYDSESDTEGVDLGALGDALSWTVSDTSIATIDTKTGVITFTGNNYGDFTVTVAYAGADGKTYTDTITISATETLYVVPGDGTNDFPEYPNEGAVRFDKTATAVGNYSETGIAMVELSMTGVPYSTGSEIDVVIMLDMTGSMSDTAMAAAEESAIAFAEQIVKNEDGTYNDNRIAILAFNSNSSSPFTYWALGTVDSDDEWSSLCTAVRGASEDQYSGGTPYDDALEKCQSILTAAKTDGTGNDRQQFCVFVSDGGPTSYKYITNYDEVKAGTDTAYETSSATATGGQNQSDSNFATIATYTHEYYSTLMKDAGVTMFSVLTGLSATSYPNCATILENIASSSDNAYVVEDGSDTTALTNALGEIATKIHEAATDVVVEDKIGNNYTVNFGLPGYGSANALDQTALDGLSNFYIQVVDYVLDDTTHERTNTYTVLENFTFNLDGSLASHTVDGVACSGCTHVTITDGVITKIDGTYFDYEVKADGEYLTWTAEKLNENELALQYFAYLDNSSGVSKDDQVAAGTYYTNEYATLTYTNVNGNQVQQEFPVPQMTWYGAQVSYVFYLVNEAGQPVNKAGRVIPFAEAVYVTDVYTEAVIWNDLEQSAGLEAERLATNLVPDVYALYDDDASYNIHVYADEEGVNLNNHFVIGGDITDDYNTTTHSWTNANTTYVFNNKSDGTKYNTIGAYVADDDDTTANEKNLTYLCKGTNAVTGIGWTEVTLSSDSDLVSGAYYYDVNSVKTRALTYEEGVTYYQLTAASYTTASGETQWTPGAGDSTTGGTVINNHVYYVDEHGDVYTIVQKSNGTEVREGFDFANTTVAFAVVWKPELEEDVVVVDFGLDVVVNVTENDNMAAGVTGVMLTAPNAATDGTYDTAVGVASVTSADGLWTASKENLTSVRFHMNEMGINAPAVFYYEAAVNYYKSGETTVTTTNMYSSVTVIPATTVYYEDSFVTLDSYTKSTDADGNTTWGKDETSQWSTEGTTINKTQDVDRPGTKTISEAYDANNVYGYDSAYDEMSTYSLGSAAVMEITDGVYGTATFTFYGTGFDIIGVTSSNTSLITLKIYSGTDTTVKSVKNLAVDTYYGYTKDTNGNWVVDSSASNTLYQVPVISYEGLTYGQYTVVMKCAYNSAVDHQADGSYNVYLDAIRVYDPTGVVSGSTTNTVVSDAYNKDGEAYPAYQELRANIIAASNVTVTKNEDGSLTAKLTNDSDTIETLDGTVFIDGSADVASISDYVSYGPNNELYLAKDQAIAFKVNLNSKSGYEIADVQIGLKSANGSTVTYTINGTTKTLKTTTDMYYSILDAAVADNGSATAVTIANTSDSILSLTNIKVTYKESETTTASEESGISTASLLYTDEEVVTYSLMRMSRPAVEDTEEETETTEPETETTEPETEATEPEVEETVPEETVPEETVPEETEPEVEEDTTESITETIKNFFNKISNAISNLLSRWFR